MTAITVVSIYPTLLGTYGDAGNVLALAYQAKLHGLSVEVINVHPGHAIPRGADIYVLGGGEDTAQTAAARGIRADGGLAVAIDNGAALLAICAGYQLLGEYFPNAAGAAVPGLELVDLRTDRLPSRAVGELTAVPLHADIPIITGYENHGGATHLGEGVSPLARVQHGVGNGDGTEGVLHDRIIGTYAHGPGLARNPRLAEVLLGWAVGTDLPAICPEDVTALREDRLAAAAATAGHQK